MWFARSQRASLALALLLVGCTGLRPIPPDTEAVLEMHEGILVLHVETSTAIQYLQIGQHRVLRNLEPGTHLELVVIDAGEYAWTGLHTTSGYRVSLGGGEDMEFRVLPGRINYPGQLIIRDHGRRAGISVRAANRSGMVSRALEAEFSSLVKERGLLYVGSGPRDEFFDRYRSALDLSNAPVPPAP